MAIICGSDNNDKYIFLLLMIMLMLIVSMITISIYKQSFVPTNNRNIRMDLCLLQSQDALK